MKPSLPPLEQGFFYKATEGTDCSTISPDPILYGLNSDYYDEATGESHDRFLYFESLLAGLIEQQVSSPEETEQFLKRLLNNFETVFPLYLQTLKPQHLEALRGRLRVCIEEIKASSSHGDATVYHAHALLILNEMSNVFESNARQVRCDESRLNIFDASLETEGKASLKFRSAIRSLLWAASAYTSAHGIFQLNAFANQAYFHLAPWIERLANYTLGPLGGMFISEFIRKFKSRSEKIGADSGVTLSRAMRSALKERSGLYAALLVGLVIADVSTNIEGVGDLFLSPADTSDQIDDVRSAIAKNRQAFEDQLTLQLNEGIGDQAGLTAVKVVVDEASGLYSGQAGFGPRFYALASTYFHGSPLETLVGQSSDPRCDAGQDSASYHGWTLSRLDDSSWCALSSTSGFIVGPSAHTSMPVEQHFRGLSSSERGKYASAFGLYEDFHRTHPDSYEKTIRDDWQAYINDILRSGLQDYDRIHATALGFGPTTMISEINVGIDGINQIQDELRLRSTQGFGAFEAQVEATNSDFIEFDRRLIQRLSDAGGAVDIPDLKLEAVQPKIPNFDHIGDTEVRDFFRIMLSSPGKIPVGAVLIILAFMVSYLDMAFYKSIQKNAEKDRVKINQALAGGIADLVKGLAESLYVHLAQSPFAHLYFPDDLPDKKEAIQAFVHRRLREVLGASWTDATFQSVEDGWVAVLWSKLLSLFSGESTHSLGDELHAYLDHLGDIQSPSIRAYRRFAHAVQHYADDPFALSDAILSVPNGTPQTIIDGLRTDGKVTSGADFGKRFRKEMTSTLTDMTHGGVASPSENLSDKIKGLHQRISAFEHALAKDMDIVTDPFYIIEFLMIRAAFDDLQGQKTYFPGEEVNRNALRARFKTFEQKFEAALKAYDQVIDGATKDIKSDVDQKARQEIMQSYEPDFVRYEKELDSLQHVVHEASLKSILNSDRIKAVLREKIDRVQQIIDDIKTWKPPLDELRQRKQKLLDSCRKVQESLMAGQRKLEQSDKHIAANRAQELMRLITPVHSNPEAEFNDRQKAEIFVREFLQLVGQMYGTHDGVDTRSSLRAAPPIDFNLVQQCYNDFSIDMRKSPELFGFSDRGMLYRFDPVWTIGKVLDRAVHFLTEGDVIISCPERLQSPQQIAASHTAKRLT